MSDDRMHRGSPERFAWEWDHYDTLKDDYRAQLLGWLGASDLASFADKTVLDVGCGMGRNAFNVAEAGAADVLGLDVEQLTVDAANRTLGPLANARAQQGSVYDLDTMGLPPFDRVLCIGVLHHLAMPERALEQLFGRVAAGGELHLWCYGREGNELLIPAIHALRFVGSRVPMTTALLMARGLKKVVPPILRRLPLRASYYKTLLTYDEEHLEHILLDQIIPRISHYWTRGELEHMVRTHCGQSFEIEQVNGNSWHVRVDRPS